MIFFFFSCLFAVFLLLLLARLGLVLRALFGVEGKDRKWESGGGAFVCACQYAGRRLHVEENLLEHGQRVGRWWVGHIRCPNGVHRGENKRGADKLKMREENKARYLKSVYTCIHSLQPCGIVSSLSGTLHSLTLYSTSFCSLRQIPSRRDSSRGMLYYRTTIQVSGSKGSHALLYLSRVPNPPFPSLC